MTEVARSGLAPSGDTALYYEITGTGDPIVLVHGFALDRRMWDGQIESLSRDHTVVRYDLRGFGKSAPGSSPYTHADDLAALLDHLGLDRVTVTGLSLGGGAAINFAMTRPDRVRALIAVDPSLGGFRTTPAFTAARASIPRTAAESGVSEARARWLALPMFQPALANAASRESLQRIVGDYSGWHWLHADHGRPFDPPAITRLGDIRAPTLVIIGELDTPDFHEIASTVARGIPGATKVILPGVGHMANMENAEAFNQLVLDFLDRLD